MSQLRAATNNPIALMTNDKISKYIFLEEIKTTTQCLTNIQFKGQDEQIVYQLDSYNNTDLQNKKILRFSDDYLFYVSNEGKVLPLLEIYSMSINPHYDDYGFQISGMVNLKQDFTNYNIANIAKISQLSEIEGKASLFTFYFEYQLFVKNDVLKQIPICKNIVCNYTSPYFVSNEGIGGNGQTSYNGFFKLFLRTIKEETTGQSGEQQSQTKYYVAIADGKTYNSTLGTSENSICQVNNAFFSVPYWQTEEEITATTQFWLKFTSAQVLNNETTEEKVQIVTKKNSSDTSNLYLCSTNKDVYYHLGRVLISKNNQKITSIKIDQYHTSGIAKIDWITSC